MDHSYSESPPVQEQTGMAEDCLNSWTYKLMIICLLEDGSYDVEVREKKIQEVLEPVKHYRQYCEEDFPFPQHFDTLMEIGDSVAIARYDIIVDEFNELPLEKKLIQLVFDFYYSLARDIVYGLDRPTS